MTAVAHKIAINAPTPTHLQFAAYQGMFEYFNRTLFGGELPNVLLNFSRKSARNLGFFAPKRWDAGGEVLHEISINPQTLKTRTLEEIASTLVHEMCHLWQQDFGKPSRNAYHNAEWGSKMDTVGLAPSNTGKPGGKRTGQQMTHYIVEGGPFQRMFATMPAELRLPFLCHEEPQQGKAKTNKVKYTCAGCQTKVWGKAGLIVNCGGCGTEFVQGAS